MSDELMEVPALLAQAQALLRQAGVLTDSRRPLLLRLLQAGHAKELHDRARDLMDEVQRRLGEPVDTTPERFGGFTRAGWVRMQAFVGIFNALNLIWALYDGRWISATVSFVSMLACTLWLLPRKPRKASR